MERRGIVLFFVASLACCSISAAAVTNLNPGESVSLSNYVGTSNGILIGDKLFENFSYVAGGVSNNLSPDAISLTALSNSVGFGLTIGGPFENFGNTSKDFILQYSVDVTNKPGFLISDIHMTYNGNSYGTGGYSTIDESVYSNGFGAGFIGQIDVHNYGTNAPPLPPPQFEDQLVFAQGHDKVYVQKDIVLGGFNANDHSSISIINQTFSQIPEPSSMVLAGIGLSGLWLWRRKRH